MLNLGVGVSMSLICLEAALMADLAIECIREAIEDLVKKNSATVETKSCVDERVKEVVAFGCTSAH